VYAAKSASTSHALSVCCTHRNILTQALLMLFTDIAIMFQNNNSDLVDGKSAIPERANTVLTRGYSAIYYYTGTSGFKLAASAKMNYGNSTNAAVDIKLPEAGIALLKQVKAYGYASKRVATSKFSIAGTEYYTSVRCAFANEYFTSFGRQPELTRFDGGTDCTTFFVQAMPTRTVAKISMMALQVSYDVYSKIIIIVKLKC
jgi:hypothetical protein